MRIDLRTQVADQLLQLLRFEEFSRTGYFVPERYGTGPCQISRIVQALARALFGWFLRLLFY